MIDECALRALPQTDAVLRANECAALLRVHGAGLTCAAVKTVLHTLRAQILDKKQPDTSIAAVCEGAALLLRAPVSPRRVINASGIALHTGLGRAPLALEAREAVQNACGYTDIEYDLAKGRRGERGKETNALLRDITGCEAAFCVNNNAAALLLALSALAKGRPVAVSRGELVEIGGGFRVSEIMALCGGKIEEVGTTNRTHLRDYEAALKNGAGLILKVHTSNFYQSGFTASVELDALCALGKRYHVPVIADIGSGAVLPPREYPFDEPGVPQAVAAGADVLVFSGDKLLGGPQAGIICGKSAFVEQMRVHPLARAVRIDKLSLAALTATLRLYVSAAAAKERVPVLQMVCHDADALREKALRLQAAVLALCPDASCALVPTVRPVGGGSVPNAALPGFALAINARAPAALAAALREAPVPVIALVRDHALLLDTACMADAEIDEAAKALAFVLFADVANEDTAL